MENGISNDINDFLIVQKIPIFEEIIEEKENTPTEEKPLLEDYEVIVKKQLRILQADERGRRAYNKEIAKNKKLQEERSEVLNAKRQALENEKERAQRVASLPPPLPKSIKSLLNEMGKKETVFSEKTKKDDQTSEFNGIQGTAVSSRKNLKSISDSENKENMLNDNDKREKERLEAERDMKARLRFNEAWKKDRLKQECTETLKQIHNAEQATRRQQAKCISIKGGTVPCPFSDKLGISEKQSLMEDVVENICKNTKEHVIEDLEGYEDQLNYASISDKKNQMIDCVPKFVKENYSYLLEDESEYQCGKRFSGLDESFDELNMAYIESPVENTPSSVEIDAVISQLDKMRAETNKVYEKEFKPLLEKGDLQKNLVDKSIETDILKQPTEHKSIDNCDVFLYKKLPCASQSVQVDLLNDYERETDSNIEPQKNIIKENLPYSKFGLEQLIPEIQIKWKSPNSDVYSSSSYMSLPSNHGIPDIYNFFDYPKYKHPTAHEIQKDCIPLSKAPKENDFPTKSPFPKTKSEIITTSKNNKNDELSTKESLLESEKTTREEPSKKIYLSSLIKQVADKYLKNKQLSPISSTADHDKFESPNDWDSKIQHTFFPYQEEKFNEPTHKKVLNYFDDKIVVTDRHCESQFSDSSFKPEHKLIKERSQESKVHASSSHNIDKVVPLLTEESKIKSTDEKNVNSAKQHEYHELSTIPEVDSALVNDTIPSFLLPNESFFSKKSVSVKIEKVQQNTNLTSPSLKGAPTPDVTNNVNLIKAKSKTIAEILVQPPKIANDFTSSHSACISSQSQPQTPTLSPSLYTASVSKFSDLSNVSTPFSLKSENSFSSSSSDLQRTPYSSSFQNFRRKPPYLTNIDSLPKFFEDVSSIKQTGRAVKYHGGFETSHFPSKYSEVESASWGQKTKIPKYATPIANDDEKFCLPQSSANSFKMLTPISYESTFGDEIIIDDKCNVRKFSDEKKLTENKYLLKSSHLSNSSLSNMVPLSPVSYLSSPNQSRVSPSITINEHISIPTKFSQTKNVKSITVDREESDKKRPEGNYNAAKISEDTSSNFQALKGQGQIDSLASVTLHSSISFPHRNRIQFSSEKSNSEQSFKFMSPVSYLSSPTDNSAQIDCESVVTPITLHKTPTTDAWKYAPGTFDNNSSITQQLFDYNFVAGDNSKLPQLKSISQKYMAKPSVKTSLVEKEVLEENKYSEVPAQVCKSDFFVPSTNQNLVQLLKSVNEPQLKLSTPSIVSRCNEINVTADNVDIFDQTKVSLHDIKSKPTTNKIEKKKVLSKHGINLQTPTSDSSNSLFAIPSTLRETFQSTPVKTFEEIVEEAGLMEEPELTLFNSIMIKPGSPDNLQVSSNVKNISKAIVPESTNSVHKTASELFAPSPHYCDSPSMMSFLKHEISCISDPSIEVSPVFTSQSSVPEIVQKKSSLSVASQGAVPKTTQKKCLPSKKTLGKEYKSRTKRLWENLEEVKSRKKMEARKEEISKNQQKMKAYAKRLATPKRKS